VTYIRESQETLASAELDRTGVSHPTVDTEKSGLADHTIGSDSENTIRLGINDSAIPKTDDTICLEIDHPQQSQQGSSGSVGSYQTVGHILNPRDRQLEDALTVIYIRDPQETLASAELDRTGVSHPTVDTEKSGLVICLTSVTADKPSETIVSSEKQTGPESMTESSTSVAPYVMLPQTHYYPNGTEPRRGGEGGGRRERERERERERKRERES
ncbi:hypothetical protein EGW08_016908, partial [Elysia chlorotica]